MKLTEILTIKFINMRTITFNELRRIKDSLPTGSMHRIADELGLNVDTVRNFFGGHNFKEGKSVGIHLEPVRMVVWLCWMILLSLIEL